MLRTSSNRSTLPPIGLMRRWRAAAALNALLMASLLSSTTEAQPSVAATGGAPTIAFENASIVVSNVGPGERVILFGVSRQPVAYGTVLLRRTQTLVAPPSGVARFAYSAPIGEVSIYAAVNYDTGAYVLGAPHSFPLRLATFPAKALRKDDTAYDALDLDRANLFTLCVRPRKNAWSGFLVDGAPLDHDGRPNGHTTVAGDALASILPGDEKLKQFHEHDVVVVIDTVAMDVMATEVPK